MSKKSILITGVAGFIGFHVCEKMLKMGFDIIGIDNLNDYYDVELKQNRLNEILVNSKKEDNFRFIHGDISDINFLNGLFANYKINIVLNLAGQAGVRYSIDNPSSYIQSNIVGFSNLIELAKNNNVEHFIYASSSSVYGLNKNVPFSELENVESPISLYAATKKSNELIAHTYSHLFNLKTTGLRFFTVYGPWGRPDMAYFKFCKSIFENNPIEIYNNGLLLRDFTYVDDIVDGIISLIEINLSDNKVSVDLNTYEIFNIGNDKPISVNDFILRLEKIIGKKANKVFKPMQKGDVFQTHANISKIKSKTAFQPKTDIESGLSKFVAWYKQYYKL